MILNILQWEKYENELNIHFLFSFHFFDDEIFYNFY